MGLTNYWGYNTIGFFAVEPRLGSTPQDGGLLRSEFREMVRSLHAAGIEVILDVVFNHTAESDATGPALAFRGLDNANYYRLPPRTAATTTTTPAAATPSTCATRGCSNW